MPLVLLLCVLYFWSEVRADFVYFLDGRRDNSGCVRPGGLVISEEPISELQFEFEGKKLYFFPVPALAKGEFRGVRVCDVDFPVEHIRVRKKFPSDKIKKEKVFLREVFKKLSPKMWEGNFILPVKSYRKLSWNFGVRRKINGYTAGFHRGIDISAPEGTPVFATNSGRVAVAREFTLEGNLVVIDHGTGIFSIYAHLEKIHVREGEFVRKGKIIGEVGDTGRATGPHLHFGIKVMKVDIDPRTLLQIEDILKKFTGKTEEKHTENKKG